MSSSFISKKYPNKYLLELLVFVFAFACDKKIDSFKKANVGFFNYFFKELKKDLSKIELYSIEPYKNPNKSYVNAQFLDYYPVLGSLEISNKINRSEVWNEIYNGCINGNYGAACFLPRHIVVMTSKGKKYNFIVCYECMRIVIRTENDLLIYNGSFSGSPDIFNNILIKAKITLAE